VTAIAVTALGAAGVVLGVLGLQGRRARMPSDTNLHNHSAHVLFGSALVGMGLISLLKAHPVAVGVLALPMLASLVLGLYAYFVRPPRWFQPRWQREIDDDERRSREMDRQHRRSRQ
jgi:hypothetical protein